MYNNFAWYFGLQHKPSSGAKRKKNIFRLAREEGLSAFYILLSKIGSHGNIKVNEQ